MSIDINVQTFSGKVNINNNLLVGSGHLFVDTQNNLVGLRTSDPQAGLHVESNTYVRDDFRVGSGIVMNETLNPGRITAGSFVGDGSALQGINSDSGSWVNGTDVVYLSTIGDKVGIGVNPPLHKLDVDGDINFTGALKINGTPAVFSNWTVSGSDIYRSSGNVGIGVTDPDASLEVKFPSNDGSVPILSLIRDGTMSATTGTTFRAIDIKTQQTGSYDAVTHASINLVNYNTSGSGQFGLSQPTRQDTGLGFSVIHDGSTVENALVIGSTGNVGIGTTSPGQPLDVQFTGDSGIRSKNTGSSHASVYIDSASGYSYLRFEQSSVAKFWLQSTPTGDLAFRPSGGGHVMDIKNNGKVGIGTSSPQSKLNVLGTISTGRNLAREVGSVISYSSQYQAVRGAANVINGKKNYELGNADWITANGQRNNAYVVIDLGAAYTVDRVVIYNQNEYPTSHREVKQFTLQGSTNNSTWVNVIVNDCGRSNAHEPNPGWSFRIPQDWDDDNEGSTSYRYWKFIMNTFHGTDGYGGIMELELYEAPAIQSVDDEISTSSLVAQDVYSQTGNFSRGVTIGKGYGGTSTGGNNLLVEGNVGIGITNPDNKLEVRGTIQASASDTNHGMFLDHDGTIRRDYGAGGAGFHFTGNAIWPTDRYGTYVNNQIDLGNTLRRFKTIWSNNSLNSTSDDRLKHNEEEVVDALGTIKKLKLLKYDKTGEMLAPDYNGDLTGISHRKELGFIAQSVLEIPELSFLVTVPGDPEDELEHGVKRGVEPYGMEYQGINNLLVQAVQEVDRQLQTTRTQLEVTTLKLLNTEARLGVVEQAMTSILSKLNV